MIDPRHEKLLPFKAATRHPLFANPATGKPCHLSGIYRYVHSGARGPEGRRVRLEAVRTPRGLVTSEEAIERFFRGLNGDVVAA
jgi:hypothetical protein